jgi:type IX secretion system PorP/SprF family membrane protein
MYQMLGDGIKFTGYNDALSKHYTAIGGYRFKPKQRKIDSTQSQRVIEKFEFQPSIMFNYVKPIPTQVSFMFKTTYNDKIWLGITYRTQDAMGMALGVNVSDRFTIGYGFDYSMGSIKGYNTGSHELTLSFITTSKKVTLDDKDEELNNSIFEDNKKKFNKKNKE